MLGLFFLYPWAISPLSSHPTWPSLYWALFGFSAVAGAVFLTLLPAVRRGAAYVSDNGSPWRWPMYPWVLFGMLGLCVCMRAIICACVSSRRRQGEHLRTVLPDSVPDRSERSADRSRRAFSWHFRGRAAVVLPGLLLLLSMAGHRTDAIYGSFMNRFVDTMHATPLYMTLLAGIGLYGYSLARGLPGAGNALAGAGALLAFVTQFSMDLDSVGYQRAWPLIAVGAVQVAIGCERRDSVRTTLARLALAPLAFAHLGWLAALPWPGGRPYSDGRRAYHRRRCFMTIGAHGWAFAGSGFWPASHWQPSTLTRKIFRTCRRPPCISIR